MGNILRRAGALTVIFCLLGSLILPLTGCSDPPWDTGMVLNVKIDTPKNGSIVTVPAAIISGHVVGTEKSLAIVKINNTDVSVKDDKFSANVTLAEGTNIINVEAIAGGAMPSKTVTITYAPAKSVK